MKLKQHAILGAAVGAGFEFVLADFAAEGVAVNAQDAGGAGLVAVGAVERLADELLFEFDDGFVEENAPFDHLPN